MSKKKIGVITIGQTPRPDVEQLVDEVLGDNYTAVIRGALDDLKIEDIPEFRDDEYILMTGMRDAEGNKKSVRVTREFLTPLIQAHLHEIEDEVDVAMVWCAGRFPEFESRIYMIRPCEVLEGVAKAILKRGRLGVIYPSTAQLIWTDPEWSQEGMYVYGDSPRRGQGREKELELLGERLKEQNLDLILLNCTGFGYDMKKLLRKITGKPVIQANALALRVIKELLH